MERAIQIHVEEMPDGLFLATSEELQGLVAQGRTVAEALDIARDVAGKLIEAKLEREGVPNLPTTAERRDFYDRSSCVKCRLAGFRYREIVRKLKTRALSLIVRRQVVTRFGSTVRAISIRPSPIIRETCPRARFVQF